MKITMIEPQAPGKHVFSNVNMPRLGLPILATQMRARGHQVRLLMGSRKDVHLSSLMDADLIAISTTTSTTIEAYHLADYARSLGKTVVMGGAHATFLTEEALQHCDYVCRGESDLSFAELVSCLENGQSPSEIPGLSFCNESEFVHNPAGSWVDVNAAPYPDFSIFSKLKMSVYPVMTSRGCPFDCSFCSVTSMFGRKYRCRSQESVLEELQQYRGKQVFFVDDNFTANPRHSKELLKAMIERNIRPSHWYAQVRTDAARDPELLRLMAAAGCKMVFVGMESINPRTLESFNKRQAVEDIENCVAQFHKCGIMVHGMFVFGSDDDTAETIEDTLTFALKNHIDTVQFLILTPLPGTRTFDTLKDEGRLLTMDWNLYDAHHVVYQPVHMTPAELQKCSMGAFHSFYSFKNIFANLKVSGWQSIIFRASGYWLIRRWERDNAWYYRFLDAATSTLSPPTWAGRFSRSIRSVRLRRLKYVSSQKLLDIEMWRGDNTFMVSLKGYLNDFSLKEYLKALKKNCPDCYQNIVINVEELTYASEGIALKFIKQVNRLAEKSRDVRIRVPASNNRLLDIITKYDLSVPVFNLTP